MLQDISHIDVSFDEQLKGISELNWLPWIGRDYQKNKYSDQILIIGESHYDWHDDDSQSKIDNKDFTRFIVEEQGFSHLSTWQQKDGEWYWRFIRNLEKAFFGEKDIDVNKRECLWHSVAFYNLVQRCMEKKDHRPSRTDYIKGWQVFFELIKIIHPSYCIVLGTENNKINEFNLELKNAAYHLATINWGERIGRTYFKYIDLKSEVLPESKILFIRHPSSFFSWEKWSALLEQKIPIFIDELRKNSQAVSSLQA